MQSRLLLFDKPFKQPIKPLLMHLRIYFDNLNRFVNKVNLYDLYTSINGQASDGDLPNSVSSDPGYITCSKGADSGSFAVTVSDSGNGTDVTSSMFHSSVATPATT
jgi:hypothetical protein